MPRCPQKKQVDVDSIRAWKRSTEGQVIPPEDVSLHAIAELIIENHNKMRYLEEEYDNLQRGLDDCISDLNSVDMVLHNLGDTYIHLAEKKAKRERIK